MSKKEKQNSEISPLDSNSTSASASMPAETKLQESSQKNKPLSDNPDNPDGVTNNKKISQRLFQLMSVFPFLWRLVIKVCKSVRKCVCRSVCKCVCKGVCKGGSFAYNLFQNAKILLFRFVSFFKRKTAVSNISNDNSNNNNKNNDQNSVKSNEVKNIIGKEEAQKNPQTVKPQSIPATTKTVAAEKNVVAEKKIDNIDNKISENNKDNKDNKGNKVNENIEDDEDIGFRWLNLGIKITAAAAVVLVLTGGYFGVKSFLVKPQQESPMVEETAETAETTTETKMETTTETTAETTAGTTGKTEIIQPKTPELSSPPSSTIPVAKKIGFEVTGKTPENSPQQPAATPEQKLTEKKPIEKTIEKGNEKETEKETAVTSFQEQEQQKSETNFSKPEKDVTVKNNNSNAPNDSKTATVNPWAASSETTISDFSSPIVPSTSASSTPASLTPAVTTNSVASPELPFSLESSAVQNEKENVVQNSLALSPTTTTTTATTPEPLSPELSLTAAEQSVTPNLTPLAIANTETPAATVAGVTLPAADVSVTAKTAQLTPLKIQSATTDAPSSPPSSNFSDTKISGNQALTIPKSEGEVQTLPQLSAFSQPSSEPSLNIPEQSHTNSEVSGEFSKAPTPPEMTSPISSPIIEPVIPVVTTKKEETVPAIPKSGTVQTFADVTDSALTSLSPSEPSPAIPTDSVTFTQPAAPLTASSPAPVTQTPFVPPTLPQSTLPQSTAPQSTVSAPFASNTETVAKIEEPVLKIPKDSQHSDVTVSAMPIPAAAILPQHRELAKVEPPLGSQLQNQVREIRNQESSETRLRFGSDAHAPTGAVRYHPKSTVQNINDLHSSQAMPIDASDPNSNPLVTLLPNGNGNPTPETFNSLPPLEKAPKFETATPNPAYRRSLNLETPVSVQPENLSSMPNTANTPNNATINNSERRAKLFRRIDDEIKRSPESAEQYTVQKNDTYMTISDRFFGTIRLFRALAEYNRQKYGTDYKLPEGTIVEIPPVDYLKTNYAEMFTRSRQRPEKNITVSGSGVRYIVQEEDTVFRIATNQLRDSSRWQEIIEMNSDKLRSPRDLQPGMEIILPVTTATQTTYGRR